MVTPGQLVLVDASLVSGGLGVLATLVGCFGDYLLLARVGGALLTVYTLVMWLLIATLI